MKILNMDDAGSTPERKYLLETIENVMNDLTPENAMKEHFNVDLKIFQNIYLIGFGKAAYGMYAGIRDHLLGRLAYAGIIIPDDQEEPDLFPELEILRGTHPYVSQLSVDSSIKLLSGIGKLSEDDLVIVLISGGGSSLFEIPEKGVRIDDIKAISKEIMDHDGDIYTLNRIRSLLSSVKGGKLAGMLHPASVVSYIISDVIYDDMAIIASGPLVKSEPVKEISLLVSQYVKTEELVRIIVEKGIPGPREDRYFSSIENKIILCNSDFVNAIFSRMEGEKITLGSNINGDVNSVAADIGAILRSVYDLKGRGFHFVCGGETTVNVKGAGYGGRNQELVLRLLKSMDANEKYTFCSIGTDGIDGKSTAAGGIVDQDTRIGGLDKYLDNNDSYNALSSCHGTILTGRTGNNVSDLIVGYYSGGNDNF